MNDMLRHLNTDGNELIYEEPGDAQRGNPLDVVTIAEVRTARTVTGRKFTKKDQAFALKLFANSAAMLDLLSSAERRFRQTVDTSEDQGDTEWMYQTRQVLRDLLHAEQPNT